MNKKTEIRTLLTIILVLIGMGFLFWGMTVAVSRFSGLRGGVIQEGEYLVPSEGEIAEGEEPKSEEDPNSQQGPNGEEPAPEVESATSTPSSEPGDPDHSRPPTLSGEGKDLTEAETLFQEALVLGGETGKPVFLRFGAAWCPGCWQIKAFLAQVGVQEILGHKFIETEIDLDTIEGARPLLLEMAGEGTQLPWYALFDSSGNLMASSDNYEKNIGFMPIPPEDRDHFISMFAKTQVLSEDELTRLRSLLDSHIDQNLR